MFLKMYYMESMKVIKKYETVTTVIRYQVF